MSNLPTSPDFTRHPTYQPVRSPLFALGQVVATPGALDLLDHCGANAPDFLVRHVSGDWGIVCEEDGVLNSQAVTLGNRILSSYAIGAAGERLWIITECDRSVTTLLLPEEY